MAKLLQKRQNSPEWNEQRITVKKWPSTTLWQNLSEFQNLHRTHIIIEPSWISEAVLIDELSAEETMNAKNEWTYVKLNKLSMH